MNVQGNIRLSAGGFFLVAVLVVLSHGFLDERIARTIHRLLQSDPVLSRYASDIPDLLLPAVLILSSAMWTAYLRRVRRGQRDDRSRFYLLAGTALPLAFIAKWVLKHVFGRLNTRVWLEHPSDLSFHWFHGGGEYSGFPSGHMAVFTTLAAACWFFFPKVRGACLFGIVVLATALIATGHHFLSDVIAGGYLGFAVLVVTGRWLGFPGDIGRPPG